MVEKSQKSCAARLRSLADDATPSQEPHRHWVARVPCRARPEVFYTNKHTTQGDIDAALALCQGCPVRRPCLQEALAYGDPRGIWGGTTEEQGAGAWAGKGHRCMQHANPRPTTARAAARRPLPGTGETT